VTTQARLRDGLGALSAQYPALGFPRIEAQLLDYLELLNRWNEKFNLTAIKNKEEQVSKHLLDSLVVAPHLSVSPVIDVGSGAGLPGIPIAILCPNKSVYLLDSNSKKTRFLVEVKARLKLDNVRVVNARVEDFAAQTFDELICRAFCPLPELLTKVQHLVSKGGQVFAMLGQKPSSDDLANFAANSWTMSALQVPLLEDARHLLTIKAH